MRNLFVLAFSIFAYSAFGANPSFEAFRGTNQVLVTTNRTTGKVVIGPSSPISTIASNAAQNVVGASNVVEALTNVWKFASSGSGTTNDPYLAWDKNITWSPRTKYNFGGYVYSYTNAPNWAHEQLELIGKGATLLYRGTGLASNAVQFITTNIHTYRILMDDFFLDCGTNATTAALDAIYISGVHHSTFRNIRAKNFRSAGLEVYFSVCSIFDNLHFSGNWDYRTNASAGTTWATTPTNGFLLNGSWSCTYLNPIAEVMAGDGFLCPTSHYSVFIGGTSEQNGGGIQINSGSFGNLFDGLAMEQNTTNNILCFADCNTFLNCYATGNKVSRFNNKQNMIIGGEYDIVDILLTATGTTMDRVRYINLTNSAANSYLRANIKTTGGGVQDTNFFTSTMFAPTLVTGPGLIVRPFFQQGGVNPFQFQSYTGTELTAISTQGWVGILTNVPQGALSVFGQTFLNPGASNLSVFRMDLPAGQRTNLFEVFNSSGTEVFSVSSNGTRMYFGGKSANDVGVRRTTVGQLDVVTGDESNFAGLKAQAITAGGVLSAQATANLLQRVTIGGSTLLAQLSVTNQTGAIVNTRIDQQGTTNDVLQAFNNNTLKASITTNGIASFNTLGTNAVGATGYTNLSGANQTAYVTATAVSWTITDRSANVLYVSPTLTATVPIHLQPGWSVTAASGLVGTVLPE